MFLTALIMGMAGSLHCLGMCSPLVVAVTNLRGPALGNRLLYNGGRIFTYGIIGGLASGFGSLFHFTGFQNILSFILGSALIFIAVSGTGHFRIPLVTTAIQKISAIIKNLFARFVKERTGYSLFAMGMLNGLLPCGLTFLALTYCLTVAGFPNGFMFMIVFGIGTLPVMLGITSLLKLLIQRFNFSFHRFSTITMVVLGVLLIARSAIAHHRTEGLSSGQIVICK